MNKGVSQSHCGLAIYIIINYLKAKKKSYENSRNIIIFQKPSYENRPIIIA
jgi:hypothetical protein